MTELKASPVIDKMVQTAHIWIKEIMYELNLTDSDKAYHVLRATLQTLRDRLPPEEAIHLGAQLPTLIRGVYYESWKISDKPLKMRKKEDFFDHVAHLYNAPLPAENESAVRAVFKQLHHHLSLGEVDNIKDIIPKELKDLWPHKV